MLREWLALTVPLLALSARETDSSSDLVARMEGWLRKREAVSVLEVGTLRCDLGRRVAFVEGKELHLTPTEYRLLVTLMRNHDRVMAHKEIIDAVWGPSHANETQYLRVYVRQLRLKLEPDPACPRYVVTEPCVGYRLKTHK
jgi:two-component system KDP operon response regulator KdpE